MRFVLCAVVLASAAAGVISSVGADGPHDGAAATGRRSCPVDLAAANYTVLTSKCVWPPFHPAPCCAAFKELACPYAKYINDNSTDCADTLFRYIDIHGGYPPGVFYDNCREGPKGLKCPHDHGNL